MHRANPNGLSDSLQEREVDMHIEPLRLLSGEAAGDILEPFPHRIEMIEPLLEPEVGQVVRADLVAQEHGELLVLLDEGILAVGAEDMVAGLPCSVRVPRTPKISLYLCAVSRLSPSSQPRSKIL